MNQTMFFLMALMSILPADVYFYVWHKIDEQRSNCRYFLGPQSIQAAYDFIVNNLSVGNLYIGVTGCRQDLGAYNRPKKDNDDCAGIFAFWVDIDVAHPCHKKGNLPTDLKQATELSYSIGMIPSFLVSSGHGLHAWYLLDQFFYRTAENASYINSLLLAIKEKFQNNEWGYAVDNTFDTSRVLRIPGTINLKVGHEPAQVSIALPRGVTFSTGGLAQLRRYIIEEWFVCLGVNFPGNTQILNPTTPVMITLADMPNQIPILTAPATIPATQPIVSATPVASTETTAMPAGIPNQAPILPAVAPVLNLPVSNASPTQTPISEPPASMPVVHPTQSSTVPTGQPTTPQPPAPSSPPTGAPLPPFVLNPNATVEQTRFDNLYAREPFRQSWERQRTDLRDTSSSGYDQSITNFAVYAGWSDQEVVNLLAAYCRKWNENLKTVDYYRRTLATARAGAAGREANPKVRLNVGGDYSDLVNTTLQALLGHQQEEQFFLYSELGIIRIEYNPIKKRVGIVPVGTRELTGHIMKYIEYIRIGKTGSTTTPPPMNVLSTVLTLPASELKFRLLRRIVDSPVLLEDGRILTTPGYDKNSQLYYAPKPGFSAIGSIENLTVEDVKWACLSLGDLIYDFAFRTEADRTNCIAMFLTPFIRDLTPLAPIALVNAPMKGTGKTLLCDIAAELATGAEAFKMPGRLPDEIELKKILTSILMEGYTMAIFDNVASELKLDALASVLTMTGWTGRILGVSKIFQCENRLTFIANGNNLSVGSDMDRRAYEIRLESRQVNPSRRNSDEFRHPDIRAWVKENRANLVKAILILIKAWVLAGRPPFKGVNLGSFEAWVQITGGILGNAGFNGFLGNLDEMYNRVRADDSDDGEVFLKAVLQYKWGNIFTVNEICALITSGTPNPVKNALPGALQQKSGPSLSTALGVFFKSFQGRRFQSEEKVYYLDSPGKDSGNARLWQFFEDPA